MTLHGRATDLEGIPRSSQARSAERTSRKGKVRQAPPRSGQTPLSTRGYQKIKGATDAFNFDFRDKVVLDIGSSTGGFTQYALDRGAKKVIAVEKGTNQMMAPLRFNPRVELHEKTDIFNFRTGTGSRRSGVGDGPGRAPTELPKGGAVGRKGPAGPALDAIIADVSFISLTEILAYAKLNLANRNTDFLVMLKPQFEAEKRQLNKGVVKNEKIRREIIKKFEQWLKQNNFLIIQKCDNDLKGKTGNKERFYHLKLAK